MSASDAPGEEAPLPGGHHHVSHHAHRLASSIRLPWIVGLATLVVAALAAALFVGRVSPEGYRVPGVVLDDQERLATQAAQSVRRGLNEGVDDLVAFARVLREIGGTKAEDLRGLLADMQNSHGRYLGVAVLNRKGRTIAATGDLAPSSELVPLPIEEAGMGSARPVDGALTIPQWAPIAMDGPGGGSVVATYDPAFLKFPLESLAPGDAWVVDAEGRVVGGLGYPPDFTQLPREPLRSAAEASGQGKIGSIRVEGALDRHEIVAWSPASGLGPAGGLGWGVVTSRSVTSLNLPAVKVRRDALLAGFLFVILTVLIFGWMYAVVIRPLVRLQEGSERLRMGDLSHPIMVERYDEIGLLARTLERLRVELTRKRSSERPDE